MKSTSRSLGARLREIDPRTYRTCTTALAVTGVAAAAGALLVQALLLDGHHPSGSHGNWRSIREVVDWSLGMFVALGVGVVASRKQPHNVIGWPFALGGAFGCVALLGEQWGAYALLVAPAAPGGRLGWFLSFPGLYAAWALLGVLVPLLFPDGRFRSTFWTWVAGIAVASAFLWSLEVFRPRLFEDGYTAVAGVDNPLGIPASQPVLDVLTAVGLYGLFASMFLAIASLVPRVFTSQGIERQQMKVIAYTVVATTIVLLVGANLRDIVAVGVRSGIDLVMQVAGFAIPVSFGVAIFRYRLYDVDLVINRTLVYGTLTVFLAAAYAGLVIVLQGLMESIGSGSNLAVAASTLAVAALVSPARRRIQSFIDRRFYRRKYDAERTLATFSTRLRDQVDIAAVTADLVRVVQDTMQPRQVSLWLRRSS